MNFIKRLRWKLLRILNANKYFVLILVGIIILRSFVFVIGKIPSSSMEPNFYPGDRLVIWNNSIDGFVYPLFHAGEHKTIERGDVIVFSGDGYTSPPDNVSKFYIKRIIAVGGDTVRMQDSSYVVNGEVLVREALDSKTSDSISLSNQGKSLYREYNGETSYLVNYHEGSSHPRITDFREISVPDGYLFVSGDNRDLSADSRWYGFVKVSAVIDIVD